MTPDQKEQIRKEFETWTAAPIARLHGDYVDEQTDCAWRGWLARAEHEAGKESVGDGKLWSFMRSAMTQGADIHQDYMAGRHANYEAYSARLDTAAIERADKLTALLSAQPASAAGKEWRPIAEAPKDGTPIIGWRKDCDHIMVRWTSADAFLSESEIEDWGGSEESLFQPGWFFADFLRGGRLEGDEVPKLWQPMPAPPEAK